MTQMSSFKQCEQRDLTNTRCALVFGHPTDTGWPDSGHDFGWRPDAVAAPPGDDLAIELSQWWRDQAEDEIRRTVPKSVEYGADDLVDIGRELVACGVRLPDGPGPDEEKYAELGIFFYEVGKMARWRSAVRRGDRPSDDTLFDFGVYIRMAQRVRQNGQWP